MCHVPELTKWYSGISLHQARFLHEKSFGIGVQSPDKAIERTTSVRKNLLNSDEPPTPHTVHNLKSVLPPPTISREKKSKNETNIDVISPYMPISMN